MSIIPRIAFQIYLDGRIPEEHYQSSISMKRHLKGFEYRMYTDADNIRMLENHLPRYLTLYQKSDDANKRAIAACGWLNCHGGIYMDPDLVIRTNNVSYIIDGPDIYLLQCSHPTRALTNNLMASVEGSEFWINVLDCALIDEREAPSWAYDIDPESVTANKNFDNIDSGEPLDLAYSNHGGKYRIVILDYGILENNKYLYSVRTFKNRNPAAWRHVDWAKWLYIIAIIFITLLVVILILLYFYESWRIKRKVAEQRDIECKAKFKKLNESMDIK